MFADPAEAALAAVADGEVWLLALLIEGDLAPPLLGLHEVESLAPGCLAPLIPPALAEGDPEWLGGMEEDRLWSLLEAPD